MNTNAITFGLGLAVSRLLLLGNGTVDVPNTLEANYITIGTGLSVSRHVLFGMGASVVAPDPTAQGVMVYDIGGNNAANSGLQLFDIG